MNIIDKVTSINNVIMNRKFVDISIPSFFILIAVKSFEIFLKLKGDFFVSESFALN